MEQELRECLPAFGDARRIFLADGDALAAPQHDLTALFALLRQRFPRVQRVAMYANARSVLAKTAEDLRRLREQGLSILYLGVESGDDDLLAWMRKGVTAAQIAEAGRRVKEAGIKLSVTVLLGIAGSERSIGHARATGRLLSEISPDYIGALTTMIVPNTPIHEYARTGEFRLPPPFAILAELAEMLSSTNIRRGLFFANHASNYLPIKVRMPAERDAAVSMIRQFVREGDASLLKPERMRGL